MRLIYQVKEKKYLLDENKKKEQNILKLIIKLIYNMVLYDE
jgi:hypothetical protein